MLNSKVSKAVRLAIAFGAASTAAFTANVSAAEEGADKVERISVTGSRIKRTDLETAVPITTIGKAEIGETGVLNIQDILSKSPVALTGSDQSTSAFTTTTVGLNTTELRGLGEERTLVLVNGRRFVSGTIPSAGYGVDLNAIPAKLIERIDILKSASSAIYGSDAVAGVVNIILRNDIEGLEVSGQTGISDESDREKHSINLTGGKSWNGGNAWISVGFDKDNGIKSTDREFSAIDAWATDDGIIYLGSSYPPGARITHEGKDDEGNKVTNAFNGDGSDFVGGLDDLNNNRFNRAAYRQLITPLERKYVSGSLNLEISDSVTMFSEFQWNNASTQGSTIEPYALKVNDAIWANDLGSTSGMSIDSPLIPEKLRNNLQALGVTDLNQTEFVRRMVEFGPRDTSLERDTTRVAVGFDWDIDGNWVLSTYGTYGQTTQTQQNGGQINVDRAAQALNVEYGEDGQLRCVDELSRIRGCVPLNLFGAGTITDAAVDYIRSPAKVYGKVEQSVISSTLAGELPLELSGGNIGFAGGVEYRYESGVAQPGDLAQTGASSTNKAEATNGSFSTADVYVEASLPVLDNLRVDLAARQSDHSVTGNAFTYNVGAEYRPFETLMVRASYATAVRTPNIADLYGGRGETFAGVTDPCNNLKLDGSDGKSATVRANCLKDPAVAARLQEQGEFVLTLLERQTTGGFQGGNPEVKEETAETMSLGFVWQATDELSLTVDYFDIEIEDAISMISRTTVLERCYDDANMVAGCNGRYLRDGKGALVEANTGTSNEDRIKTSGFDADINYKVETGYGIFGAQLIYTYTKEFTSTSQLNGNVTDSLGEIETPKNKANINLTYELDDLNVRWKLRHWDSVVDDNSEEPSLPLSFNSIGSVTYHDISAGYSFGNNTKVVFGVNNAFDKKPPILPQNSVYGSTGINTNTRAYDVQGRAYYLNFETKF